MVGNGYFVTGMLSVREVSLDLWCDCLVVGQQTLQMDVQLVFSLSWNDFGAGREEEEGLC